MSFPADLRTPIARARGLGSAKEGTRHWWMQRLTAIALVPLTVWLVASFVAIGAADHARTVLWIRSPAVGIALLLTIAALFHHAQLGMQVVIEDYVHPRGEEAGRADRGQAARGRARGDRRRSWC